MGTDEVQGVYKAWNRLLTAVRAPVLSTELLPGDGTPPVAEHRIAPAVALCLAKAQAVRRSATAVVASPSTASGSGSSASSVEELLQWDDMAPADRVAMLRMFAAHTETHGGTFAVCG